MKRLDAMAVGLGAGDADVEMVEAEDGDLVWFDEAQARIAALEAEGDAMSRVAKAARAFACDREGCESEICASVRALDAVRSATGAEVMP